MPFGLGVANWDVLLTDEQLTLFFRQLQIINTCQTTVLALVVHFKDAGRVASFMEKFGFVDVHPFYLQTPAKPAWHRVFHLRRGDDPRGLQGAFPEPRAVLPACKPPLPAQSSVWPLRDVTVEERWWR